MFLYYFLDIVFGIRVIDILVLFLLWKFVCGYVIVYIFFLDIVDCIIIWYKVIM